MWGKGREEEGREEEDGGRTSRAQRSIQNENPTQEGWEKIKRNLDDSGGIARILVNPEETCGVPKDDRKFLRTPENIRRPKRILRNPKSQPAGNPKETRRNPKELG